MKQNNDLFTTYTNYPIFRLFNLNWLRSIIYYVQVANQIPSTNIINNIYVMIILMLGLLSSIVVRVMNVDVIMLVSPILTFVGYLIIFFSVIFILYIQYTFIFKVGHMIKYIPYFIKIIKTGNILNIKIISSYLIINTISGIISLWIISRMVIISNFGDLYVISLVVGLFISIYLFIIYNKNITELNYNIRKYPLWMITIFGSIILLLWLLVPISIVKILENYSNVLDKYSIYLINSIKMPMSDSSTLNVDTTSTNRLESIVQEGGVRQTAVSKAESHSNGLTQEATTSTNTDTFGEGVANAGSSNQLLDNYFEQINSILSNLSSAQLGAIGHIFCALSLYYCVIST